MLSLLLCTPCSAKTQCHSLTQESTDYRETERLTPKSTRMRATFVLLLALFASANAFLTPHFLLAHTTMQIATFSTRQSRRAAGPRMKVMGQSIAISSGRGNSGTELGAHIADALRIKVRFCSRILSLRFLFTLCQRWARMKDDWSFIPLHV